MHYRKITFDYRDYTHNIALRYTYSTVQCIMFSNIIFQLIFFPCIICTWQLQLICKMMALSPQTE